MQAKDIMTVSVISATPDTSVREAASIMMANRISALPVLDANERLVGIVSEGDFLRKIQSPEDRAGSWWLRMFRSSEDITADYIKSHATHVKDVMTNKVFTVNETDDVSSIASLLEKNCIKRVPVVREGKLVGIISRANLLHAIASQIEISAPSNSDKDIRAAVMEQLREGVANAHLINVVVKDGVATLMGTVNSQKELDAISVALENVGGIKSVDNEVNIVPFAATGGWV